MTLIDELGDSLQQVLPAVSRDRSHPASIRCVLVERVGDVVRVVATDKHRLAVSEPTGVDLPPSTRLLLDPTTLAEATGVEDDFPDYERFLAAPPAGSVATLTAAELADAIEAATDDGPLGFAVVNGELRVGVPEATVHIDPGYAHDAAIAAGRGDVTVEIAGATTPVAFRSTGLVSLVMPVRIAN